MNRVENLESKYIFMIDYGEFGKLRFILFLDELKIWLVYRIIMD